MTIACAPVEVGTVLKEALLDQEFSVTMTSATLATRTIDEDEPAEHAEAAFGHFLDRTGGSGVEGLGTMQLGSPYDHGCSNVFSGSRSMSACVATVKTCCRSSTGWNPRRPWCWWMT